MRCLISPQATLVDVTVRASRMALCLEALEMEFGRLRLISDRRELLLDGEPVEIGSRAFDILEVLMEAKGGLVTKSELFLRVWPGAAVEENSLQVHISALRKALGDNRGLIQTAFGRGYRLAPELLDDAAADPSEPVERAASVAAPVETATRTNLPVPSSTLVGRDAAAAHVTELLALHRIVTLTGAGGIGKTRLSLRAARPLLADFANGVWLAELAPISDPKLVPDAVAAALGLKLPGQSLTPAAIGCALAAKQVLLVLDNCEHVIETAAVIAEAIARASPRSRVLATTREPLRVDGECVYQVPPLDAPAAGIEDLDEVLRYPAVQLFLERTSAAGLPFSANAFTVGNIAAICRSLDGLPLAIEIAAARAATLGIGAVASRLHDRFGLLTGGSRTAMPRHQALRATLDWSYDLLSAAERTVLRALSVFSGGFTLHAACAVAAASAAGAPDLVDVVAGLVGKSLIVLDLGGVGRYRMLETTRAYAGEKLHEAGEADRAMRCHATFFLRLMADAVGQSKAGGPQAGGPQDRAGVDWVGGYEQEIHNLRVALDWAAGRTDEAELLVDLAVNSIPLLLATGRLVECRARAEQALASAQGLEPRPLHKELQLLGSLGWALFYIEGCTDHALHILSQSLSMSVSLAYPEQQARALWGLYMVQLYGGNAREALALGDRFLELAQQRQISEDIAAGHRKISCALIYIGELRDARSNLDRALSYHAVSGPVSRTVGHFDGSILVRAREIQLLWLEGFLDQAMQASDATVRDSLTYSNDITVCTALSYASIPMAIMLTGDLDEAERLNHLFSDRIAQFGEALWQPTTQSWGAMIEVQRGVGAPALRRLAAANDGLRAAHVTIFLIPSLGAMAEGLLQEGRLAEGHAAIDEAARIAERDHFRWWLPELLRIRAELVLAEGAAPSRAEAQFREAADMARRQGSLWFELRAALGLARLHARHGRQRDVLAVLEPVYARFSEGFETPDLRAARDLLETCRVTA
jgi:predicted ATPase/DNA-binding winged helix-turn-helix (wHTH) protein